MFRFAVGLFRLAIEGLRAFKSCRSFARWLQTPSATFKGRTPADIVVMPGGLGIVQEIVVSMRHAG